MPRTKGREKTLKFTSGSHNVFADLGFEAPEDELAKAKLVTLLRDRIDELGLRQQAAAHRMRISQPKVSKIMRGDTTGISTDWLMTALRRLGNDVQISVKPVKRRMGHLYVLSVC
jgi:predicted XRE-type DNA-binding protein